MGDRDQLVERVEGAGVHVAGLGADDDRAIECREGLAQGVGAHPALVVGGDAADALALPPHAEHLERRVDRDVRSLVGHDGDRRRALQPVPLDIPAGRASTPWRAAARAVKLAIVAPVTNPTLVPCRQAEELDEPGRRDLLGDRGGRRDARTGRRSGPRRWSASRRRARPAGCRRRRTRSSAARPTPTSPGSAAAASASMTPAGSDGPVRQRPAHGRAQRRQVDRPGDRPIGERVEVGGGELGGPMEQAGANGSVDHRGCTCRRVGPTSVAPRATVSGRTAREDPPWITPPSGPGSTATSTPGGSSTRSPSATCSAPDVRYAFDPFEEAVVGRPAVVAAWLGEPGRARLLGGRLRGPRHRRRRLRRPRPDPLPDRRPSGVDREFANIFVCRFDAEGRCREFTEWYMRRRPEAIPD